MLAGGNRDSSCRRAVSAVSSVPESGTRDSQNTHAAEVQRRRGPKPHGSKPWPPAPHTFWPLQFPPKYWPWAFPLVELRPYFYFQP